MTVSDLIRDTAFGQAVQWVSQKRLLQYPEEKSDFRLPEAWLQVVNEDSDAGRSTRHEFFDSQTQHFTGSSSNSDEENQMEKVETLAMSPSHRDLKRPDLQLQRTKTREETIPYTQDRLMADEQHEIEKNKSIPTVPRKTSDGAILVDWYYTDDPENPQNWSTIRRVMVTAVISLYTFVVYMSSAIYTTSEEGVMEEFGVGQTKASLGLSLFVLGYGVGPLLFSPLSELPAIGRNPIYIVTMFLFVVISIPTATPHNYAGLMVLRFLQGFFGSPCLASGGASIGDMFSLLILPYALIAWVAGGYCAPALGPLVAGFAVPVLGWRWALLEILWASIPGFIVMFLFLPETSHANILLRRAARLRKLTGNNRFRSQSELDQANKKASEIAIDALIKPFEITFKDPAMLFVQIYSAIIYAIYYSFFEVFPLVYPIYYGMSLGQIGLVFLCILVACTIAIAIYVAYLALYMNPLIKTQGFPVHEVRLVPALFAAFGPTAGLFIFAWTAAPQFPWIAPTIGITVYGVAAFIVMQCIFVYVPLSYAQYAASLFAANDFFRSAFACGSILLAKPLFGNLGVARGVSLLGGLSTIGIIGIWLLFFFGARLRAMSKFAV